ncbi:MAG: hypothetical protein E7Z91_04325 [Cyanobacteria bacterium SIG30]|nr:hypothetical protein [Cyanobacteria bacterium SIG30]
MANSNDIPKNMGKKIAEALKSQEADLMSYDSLSMEDMGDLIKLDSEEESIPKIDINKEKPLPVRAQIKSAPKKGRQKQESFVETSTANNIDFDIPSMPSGNDFVLKINANEINPEPEMTLSLENEQDVDDAEEFEMPNNINVLKRLIGQLPAGVPKTTGALIIRQTIEALGIPMKSVLQDAQKVRECLNSSIKDCTFTIQEYKSNIKNLEKQSASYQKQLAKLNDIIGLFVYSDKK